MRHGVAHALLSLAEIVLRLLLQIAPGLRRVERRTANPRRSAVNEVAREVPDEREQRHAPSLA